MSAPGVSHFLADCSAIAFVRNKIAETSFWCASLSGRWVAEVKCWVLPLTTPEQVQVKKLGYISQEEQKQHLLVLAEMFVE